MNWLIAASGVAGGGGVLPWVAALSDATSCLVVGIGVVIALGQLRADSRQRERELTGERTQTTLDYIEQFRGARYLIAWEVDARADPRSWSTVSFGAWMRWLACERRVPLR